MVQDLPQEVHAEIIDLLQSLKSIWPLCRTIVHADDGVSDDQIDRYIMAIQWLTDHGLVSFEAMMLDPSGLSLVHAGLTSRGHDYARTLAPIATPSSRLILRSEGG